MLTHAFNPSDPNLTKPVPGHRVCDVGRLDPRLDRGRRGRRKTETADRKEPARIPTALNPEQARKTGKPENRKYQKTRNTRKLEIPEYRKYRNTGKPEIPENRKDRKNRTDLGHFESYIPEYLDRPNH